MTEFSEHLRRHRADNGLTLGAVAKAAERAGVKVSIATLSRIEAGHREPSLALKVALVDALGLDASLPDQTLVEDASENALAAAVGGRIRETRRRLGITQAELAAKMIDLGEPVDAPVVSRYETGQVLPGLPRLLVVAQALGVPVQSLLSDDHGGDEGELLAAYRAGGLSGVLAWCSGRLAAGRG